MSKNEDLVKTEDEFEGSSSSRFPSEILCVLRHALWRRRRCDQDSVGDFSSTAVIFALLRGSSCGHFACPTPKHEDVVAQRA